MAPSPTLEDLRSSVAAMFDDELTDRLRAIETEQRRLEAELALVVAESTRRELHRAERHRSIGNWLRSHTNWSSMQTTRRQRAAVLATSVPVAAEALLAGHIGVAQFDELARARANPRCGIQLAERSEVAELLVEYCEQLSFDRSRQCIRRWETLADQDGAHRDREASVDQRTAYVGPLGHGVVVSAAGGDPLQAEELTAIFERFVDSEFTRDVDARTERHGPDAPTDLLPRTDAQRRFDALVAVFRSAAGAEGSPVRAAPIVLDVITDRLTAQRALADHQLGVAPDPDEYEAALALHQRRSETASGAPLLPDDLVRIALHHHVRSVLVDSAGVVTDWGRKRRLFTGPARQAAMLAATECARDGCRIRGRHCQVDHLHEWTNGGRTDQANAGTTCAHDNRARHQLDITVRRTPDGYLNWHRRDGTFIAPVGRRRHPDDDEITRRIRERVAQLRPAQPA